MLKNFTIPHILLFAMLSTSSVYGTDNGGGRAEKPPENPRPKKMCMFFGGAAPPPLPPTSTTSKTLPEPKKETQGSTKKE